MTNKFSVVVATDNQLGIGKNNLIPWKLSGDMKFFRQITTCKNVEEIEKIWMFENFDLIGSNSIEAESIPKSNDYEKSKNVVILGRKTWDSLPDNFRPLPDRENVVLSRSLFRSIFPGSHISGFDLAGKEYSRGNVVESSLDDALIYQTKNLRFVIGGGKLYEEAVNHEACESVYITNVDKNFDCDVCLSPDIFINFKGTKRTPHFIENEIRYQIYKLERIK